MPRRKIPVKRIKAGIRGYEIQETEIKVSEGFAARIKPIEEDVWEFECPTDCSHYRIKMERYEKYRPWKGMFYTGKAYCLAKLRPSKCSMSRQVATPTKKKRRKK